MKGFPICWPVATSHRYGGIIADGGQGFAVRAVRHRGDRAGITGEGGDPGARSGGQHGVSGLTGGADAPCCDALQRGEAGVGTRVTQDLALKGQLAGDRDVTLAYRHLAVVNGQDRDRSQADGQGHEERDEALPSAHPTALSALASADEATFGLAERRVASRVGADPGGGLGGGLQQAAAVKVGRVTGAAYPVGCDVVKPGPDDPVGVGFGEPGIAQQRPGGQQHLVADLHGAGREGEQPFGGEGLQDRLKILCLGCGLAFRQFRPGRAIGRVHAVAAGSGQPGEDVPRRGPLGGGEAIVGPLRAFGDGPFDTAGPFIVGEGENVPGTAAPGLVKGVRQQRQHPRARGRPRMGDGWRGHRPAGTHLP